MASLAGEGLERNAPHDLVLGLRYRAFSTHLCSAYVLTDGRATLSLRLAASEPVHDAGLMGYTVELTCPGCRRVRGFDPYALWWLFKQRGWDDRMASVPKRFRCTGCMVTRRRVIRPTIRITDDPPTDDMLERPTERDWKKSVKRRRT